MGRNDLLVCLQAPVDCENWSWLEIRFRQTYAPPLESEPAITRTLPLLIVTMKIK